MKTHTHTQCCVINPNPSSDADLLYRAGAAPESRCSSFDVHGNGFGWSV